MFFLHLLFLPALTFALDIQPYNETSLEFFREIDVNMDDVINIPEIDSYFDNWDTDNDTSLTHEEFKAYVDAHYPEFKGTEDYFYSTFDTSGDGVLTESDYENGIELFDEDGDDNITKDEFVKYFSLLLEGLDAIVGSANLTTTAS